MDYYLQVSEIGLQNNGIAWNNVGISDIAAMFHCRVIAETETVSLEECLKCSLGVDRRE